MKKQKLKKRQKKNNQHYSKEIVPLSHGSTDNNLKISETMKQWNNILLFLFILLLPTQLGKHFFFAFSYISGIRVDYLAPTIYLTDILAIILIIFNLGSVIKFLLNKRVLIFLSLLLFNVIVSQNIVISIYRYIKILEFLAVYLVFKKNKLPISIFIYGFLLGGIFELSLVILQFINKHSLQGLFYFFGERPLNLSMPGIAKASLSGVEILRPYGTFSHPNSLAGFYLLLYFFVLTKFASPLTNSNYFQLFKTFLLLICSLLIFISFSKIAILTFLLLNFVYLWKSPLKKYCKFCFFARTFILLIVSLVFLQAQSDPLTLQKRIVLIQNSLQIILRQPFFGTGLGNYLIVQQQFPQLFADFLNQPVHNIFFLFLSEVGLIITVIIFFISFGRIRELFKKFTYIFIVILITGLFDHYWLTLQQNFLLIGVMLGIIL